MAEDWLIFRLADGVSGRGELGGDSVSALSAAEVGKASAVLKKLLHGEVPYTADTDGARLSGASLAQVQQAAEALETKLGGSFAIAQVRTNEWWDRADFLATRSPIG